MNLVFLGSSVFGLRCLEAVLRMPDLQVVGVITAPETFSISYRHDGVTNVLHVEIADVAIAQGIPVQRLKRSMNEADLYNTVKRWKPDMFLVVGWYHMVPKKWRDLAPAYGMHASLLPDYSGGAPLVWAMINGEKKTGITLFQMDDGVDSGPIAGQIVKPIHPEDTIRTLYARIEDRGLELLYAKLPDLAQGELELIEQDETKRRIMPQRSPEDGQIDWSQNAAFIDRFIRAQIKPYPGAFSTLNKKRMTIWGAQIDESCDTPAGTVQKINNAYRVACGERSIRIHEITYNGKEYRNTRLASLFGGGQQLGV